VACHTPLINDPIPYFCATYWNNIAPPSLARCACRNHPFVSPIATTYSPPHPCQSCHKRPPPIPKPGRSISIGSFCKMCDLPIQIQRQSLAGRSITPSHDQLTSATGGYRPDHPRLVVRRAAARVSMQSIATSRRQDQPDSHRPGL